MSWAHSRKMNIFDLILDQLCIHYGWRTWCLLIVVAAAAAIVHFTHEWSEAMIAIFVVLTLVAALAGVFWQHVHDRET